MSDYQKQSASTVVTIDFADLLNFSQKKSTPAEATKIMDSIGRAFGGGDDCLGILAVTNVPNLDPLRYNLLPLARKLALLDVEDLEVVTVQSAGYQVGWSHGKEKLEGHKFDTCKGSYYANPLTDDYENSAIERNEKDRNMIEQAAQENPFVFAPNVWPNESLPELETAFKELGSLVVEAGRLVAKPCDEYVAQQCVGYTPGKIEKVIQESLYCKGRLLHYFEMEQTTTPPQAEDNNEIDISSSWCGWHNDHGSLTGLVPAIYLDEQGREVPCPDEKAGLYIKSRNGCLVHVVLPPGSLGFQIGETSQIHSGGVLQATPHAVRGPVGGDRNITRETFAVFMEPEFSFDMAIPTGRTLENTQRREAERHLPKSVRPLRSRWEPGMNFLEFSNATFAAFY